MKNILLFVLFNIVRTTAYSAESNLIVTIEPVSTAEARTCKVPVKLEITNNSKTTVYVFFNPEAAFGVNFESTTNALMPRVRPIFTEVIEPPHMIKPNTSYVVYVDLSEFFSILRTGMFRVKCNVHLSYVTDDNLRAPYSTLRSSSSFDVDIAK